MNIVQQTHSIRIALLVAMSFGLLLAAESVSAASHYAADDLEEVKATEYTDVDGEWEVELEFTDDSEYEFTLTDIADKDALHEEISETIEDKYDFAFSAREVADMAEYEAEVKHDDEDDEDEKDDDEDELEIEAERYEDIDGKWEVEYEMDDEEETFYVFDVSDEADLIEKIADHLDMSVADVEDVIEIDDDEWKDEKSSKEDAEDAIADAEKEIEKATEQIADAQEDSKETQLSEDTLADAEEMLATAKEALDAEDYSQAEEFAEDAEDKAKLARMKYIDKTAEDIEDEDDDDEFKNRGQVMSQAAQDQMIQTLLMMIITMLIQGQGGENANVDLGDLLSQLQ